MMNAFIQTLACIAVVAAVCGSCAADSWKLFIDFKRPENASVWAHKNQIGEIVATGDGIEISPNGEDPYVVSNPLDFPDGKELFVTIRIRSEDSGMADLYFFKSDGRILPENSISFVTVSGEWQEVRLALPALGKGGGIRIDPPSSIGRTTVSSIEFTIRHKPPYPKWPKPAAPILKQPFGIASGELKLRHSRSQFDGFQVFSNDKPIASGNTASIAGYLNNGRPEWLNLGKGLATVRIVKDCILTTLRIRDFGKAVWSFSRNFSPVPGSNAIKVVTKVSVSQSRDIIYLPMFTMFPGLGSFGERKDHALFPGLEYLDANEPSSSTADAAEAISFRQVPERSKICFPLMTIVNKGQYVALAWKSDPRFAGLFDTPDRFFKSGAHLTGIIYPGSDGTNRDASSLLPYFPVRLEAGKPLELESFILGGASEDVTASVKEYIKIFGLPEPPGSGYSEKQYLELASAGWLDSKIRENGHFRHALWQDNFKAGPSSDASLFMLWLAGRCEDRQRQAALIDAARKSIEGVPIESRDYAKISHIRFTMPSLFFGGIEESVKSAKGNCEAMLEQFEPDGSIFYKPGKKDYGRTHFAKDANGLTAGVVERLLLQAAVCGDPEIIGKSLAKLRALNKFHGSAPRGAQTWEVPLHTPDILASAHLVSAYLTGHIISGDKAFLDEAIHWAWTGVPFVYLVKPVEKPVGLYGTIPVFGATDWVGSWFGRPVQWCGLVYADALYRLADFDSSGPWKQLADGITISGIQQVFPASDGDRKGLLPDFYLLKPQKPAGPAINPGTLQACAMRFYDGTRMYDIKAFDIKSSGKTCRAIVHAPCQILPANTTEERACFALNGWLDEDYFILVTGLDGLPKATIRGKPADARQLSYQEGRLILKLRGAQDVEIGF